MTDCSSFRSSSSSSDVTSSRGATPRIRVIRLIRPNQSSCRPIVTTAASASFGFAIRGGREFGIGFFVSRVEKGSESDLKGLKVGDQIVRVNGYLVDDAVHRELSQYMSCQDRLTLKVRGVGMLPVKEYATDPLTWHFIPLRPDSSIEGLDEYICRDVRITLNISPRTKLGLGLCKGPEWKPGIFVQFTHEYSIAREAGLRPGDQLITCNGIDFTNILFSEAVAVMKASHTLELVVRTSAGIDLFPGESSGYNSSASSVTGDQSPCWGDQASKRLSIVKEEDGTEKLGYQRPRGWDHTDHDRRKNHMNIVKSSDFVKNNNNSNKTVIKLSANGTVINNTIIPISKQQENKTTTVILGHDDKVTIKENSHITNTTKNNIKVNINPSRGSVDPMDTSMSKANTKIADICLVSRQSETKTVVVEVHRSSTDETNSNSIPPPPPPFALINDHGSASSSMSLPSSCDASSLSSAISEEFKRRAERNQENNQTETKNIHKGLKKARSCVSTENNEIHNALMDEFKLAHKKMFKNGYSNYDKQNLQAEERQNELKRIPMEDTTDFKHHANETHIPKIKSLTERYPNTPTPDYDSSPSNSLKTINHTRINGSTTSEQPKGTMGRCAASEIAKANGDSAEMASLESFQLTTPTESNVKPPSIYFNPQSSGPPSMKKMSRPISVAIGEYIDRKEPNKFDFIATKSDEHENGNVSERLKTELEKTLSRSNLKNKNDGDEKLITKQDVKMEKSAVAKTQSNVEKIAAMLTAQKLYSDEINNKVQLRKTESTPPIINGILKNGNAVATTNGTVEPKNISFKGI